MTDRAVSPPSSTERLVMVGAAVALVVAFRALYLLRFGGDHCWMNGNFLLDAKALQFGYPAEFYGMPAVRWLLLGLRRAGATAAVAVAVPYVIGHVLLAAGILVLGRSVLEPGARSTVLLAIATAILPAFATDAGYRNVSCTLAAGLFASVAALVMAPARWSPLRFTTGALLAAAAASCRPEAALSVAALVVVAGVWGPRLGVSRRGAAAAAAGLAAGLLVTWWWSASDAGHGLSAGRWAFYTFYEANPLVLRAWVFLHDPAAVATEYARYTHSMRSLGGFEENGGSIIAAFWRHPWTAVLWLVLKPLDLVATTFLPDSFTPLAIVPFVLAVRRLRRTGWRAVLPRWAPVLGAFAVPFAFLLAWSQGHAPYLLILAPLLLLVAVWGLEPTVLALTARTARRAAAVILVVAGVAIAAWGHASSPASVPVLERASRWLETRCRTGCLVNVLPEPLDGEAWADLQAGARLPLKAKRDEAFVLRQFPRRYLDEVRFAHRVAAARASGWKGPILYVEVRTRSMQAFDEDFDPGHRLEGQVDLSGAQLAASFVDGDDRVDVFELGDPLRGAGAGR